MEEAENAQSKALLEAAPLSATLINKRLKYGIVFIVHVMQCYVSNALNLSLLNNWYQLTMKSQLFIIY